MIKAIITDVDGVIIGEKIGFNSPRPHKKVINMLRHVKEKGIPITLCTAKPYYAILDIIQNANLNNPHITDSGAVIYDPIDNVIVEKHTIEKLLAKKILKTCLENNIYIEFYTLEDYFIQKNRGSEITKKHTLVLQREPARLQNIIDESEYFEITKLMPIAKNSLDKKRILEILSTFKSEVQISWGLHPIALPLQFGIITALGSSKKDGAKRIAKSLNIALDEILGIGDTTGDWSFMELCGYTATVENGSSELKSLIKTKGERSYFIGSSVDENGFLEILDHFKL